MNALQVTYAHDQLKDVKTQRATKVWAWLVNPRGQSSLEMRVFDNVHPLRPRSRRMRNLIGVIMYSQSSTIYGMDRRAISVNVNETTTDKTTFGIEPPMINDDIDLHVQTVPVTVP